MAVPPMIRLRSPSERGAMKLVTVSFHRLYRSELEYTRDSVLKNRAFLSFVMIHPCRVYVYVPVGIMRFLRNA